MTREKHGIVFLDLEADSEGQKILDIGALGADRAVYHGASIQELRAFLDGVETLCGHNILRHDLPLLATAGIEWQGRVIDTLYLSPLLFPKHPYHALLKDDKLQSEELNNPVNDCGKAQKLYYDEAAAFESLPENVSDVYTRLLCDVPEFRDFLDTQRIDDEERNGANGKTHEPIVWTPDPVDPENEFPEPGWARVACAGTTGSRHEDLEANELPLADRIRAAWRGMICEHALLEEMISGLPVETAYALAVAGTGDEHSVTPAWVLRNYPRTANVLHALCAVPCKAGCPYCEKRLDIHRGLRRIFGYSAFRAYNGEPLQENAARAAMDGESLLAIFPTGGGKSITFQLPALLQGEAMHGLTVVISPLQSLMKDQVDHLTEAGITSAVTINGLMSPIERADACQRVLNGTAYLLFISPEQLRSKTIERLLQSRTILRFVIDEAHCFSAWGQDFRVDYLYIGDFIRLLQTQRSDSRPIPVSCFTATAKQKVISDIRDYFRQKLNLELTIFASEAERENLHYRVLYKETDQEKYNAIRALISEKSCPTIIYVSRTKKTRELSDKLNGDGFSARPFNGRMTPAEKISNQEAFLQNQVQIIVATSAFGMGVDKKDVGLVIHYDISDSLENYIQEAGRAGRDPDTRAECYVLFSHNDLDKHFILLNQSKVSMGEIQQVWRAIKELTRGRPDVCCSPLEIARQAGWNTGGPDMETRVKTAVMALENAGYVRRGRNVPRIYASGIQAANMAEAGTRVRSSPLFSDGQRENALRILQFLISRRSIARAGNDEAESRVDYIADLLGLEKREVIDTIHLLRQAGLLADTQDMSAWLLQSDSERKSRIILDRFVRLEEFLLNQAGGKTEILELKKLNEAAQESGLGFSSVRNLRTILYFWTIKGYVQKAENRERDAVCLEWNLPAETLRIKMYTRTSLSTFALENLYQKAVQEAPAARDAVPVTFSLVNLLREYQARPQQDLTVDSETVTLQDLEDALLYLSKIGAMKLEGGFLVLYNAMELHRVEKDNRARFKQEDYRLLDEFYKQKIQQIHIVGEYANMMVKDYSAALVFVRDYFRMEYRQFIRKYFKGERASEINRNLTPEKYHQLFGELSQRQAEIVEDVESRVIVAAAGPGSGKTRILTHKLASLLLMEDVKHEQLLMLTFSRVAATEFRRRLGGLIGNAAQFVEIKTFHSYCFDLIGRTGNLEASGDVVSRAVRMIREGEIEPGRIRKTVLVIDEAQDMDADEYALVQAIMEQNEQMRIIAAGDDDQNIYEFRGSSPRYMRMLAEEPGARVYEMTENFRSLGSIVAMENAFATRIADRLKSEALTAVRQEAGRVAVTCHASRFFPQAVVREIRETWKGESAAVLTSTNEEALQLFALLKKEGLPARMIQRMDGFPLDRMLEIRVFLRKLDEALKGRPVISREIWERAKTHTESVCGASGMMDLCRNLWRDFEQSAQIMYRSDLQNFIRESREEDFQPEAGQTITVSTIHKAKGREYDQVYLALQQAKEETDEDKRRLYVGLSRAREELYIHCGSNLFPPGEVPGIQYSVDENLYLDPEEIMLQLSYRDVVLNFFREREWLTGRLRAGMPLGMRGDMLMVEMDGRPVPAAKLSRACVDRLEPLRKKGYAFREGRVRAVVTWKPENEEPECWVMLSEITLERRSITLKSSR